MLDAAVRIRQHHPDAQFVLPAASEAAARLIRQAAQGLELPLHILAGQSHTALAACDVALVASGTATLEAALFKKPMVITYRVPALTAYLMRKKALLPWIGLPNILARDFVVPERVQEAATPENLATDALAWLDDAPRRDAAIETFRAMHLSLRQNASARIAEALEPYLEGHDATPAGRPACGAARAVRRRRSRSRSAGGAGDGGGGHARPRAAHRRPARLQETVRRRARTPGRRDPRSVPPPGAWPRPASPKSTS